MFTIEAQSEWIPVRGNAQASGDAADDRAVEDAIIARLNAGDEWAWCCVVVTARWNGFEGTDTLGCCSYESEADFKRTGGYYDDMKIEAHKRLCDAIEDAYDRATS